MISVQDVGSTQNQRHHVSGYTIRNSRNEWSTNRPATTRWKLSYCNSLALGRNCNQTSVVAYFHLQVSLSVHWSTDMAKGLRPSSDLSSVRSASYRAHSRLASSSCTSRTAYWQVRSATVFLTHFIALTTLAQQFSMSSTFCSHCYPGTEVHETTPKTGRHYCISC